MNWNKSSILFANCNEDDKQIIKGILNISEGTFPFHYLGIPMSSRRLSHRDCLPLIEKLCQRLSGQRAKVLCYACHLELIRSMLSTLHIFWATNLLPQSILFVID